MEQQKHLTRPAACVVTLTTTGLLRTPALSHAAQGAATTAAASAAAAAAAADCSSAALWWLMSISLLLLPPSLLCARLAMMEDVQAWHITGKKSALAMTITITSFTLTSFPRRLTSFVFHLPPRRSSKHRDRVQPCDRAPSHRVSTYDGGNQLHAEGKRFLSDDLFEELELRLLLTAFEKALE